MGTCQNGASLSVFTTAGSKLGTVPGLIGGCPKFTGLMQPWCPAPQSLSFRLFATAVASTRKSLEQPPDGAGDSPGFAGLRP